MARYPGSIDVLGFLLSVPINCEYLERERALEALQNRYGKGYSRSRLSKDIYELKRRGYIALAHQSGQISIQFMVKAHLRTIEQQVGNLKADNKFRFVSFDIPESNSYGRDMFRRALKRMGFRQLQKSLWVCDHNMADLVEMAANEYKVSEFVVYMVTEVTNIDSTIRALLNNNVKILGS